MRESVQEHWFRRGAEAGLGVGETSGAGSTTRRNCGSEWHDCLGMHAFIGVCSWSCGANLHEIVERFVEGEGGGGGRGCANGRFALPVAGQACSCRHARHGRLGSVGGLWWPSWRKSGCVTKIGSTNGQNAPFLGLRNFKWPKPPQSRAREKANEKVNSHRPNFIIGVRSGSKPRANKYAPTSRKSERALRGG